MTGAEWPVDLRGVTESVVTTRGPNDRWNVALLGLHAPDDAVADANADADGHAPVRATTYGNTRTRRNFHREGGGYVQFTRDPVLVVDAALSIREADDPVLDAADAWVRVAAEHVDTEDEAGTTLEHWHLHPRESEVLEETVPVTNRGFNAVVEATVAASRLGVPGYDEDALRERLAYFEEVCRTCGGERERAAFDRLRDLI